MRILNQYTNRTLDGDFHSLSMNAAASGEYSEKHAIDKPKKLSVPKIVEYTRYSSSYVLRLTI